MLKYFHLEFDRQLSPLVLFLENTFWIYGQKRLEFADRDKNLLVNFLRHDLKYGNVDVS